MITQKKIVLIACWYGKIPWYFNYFLHSTYYNKTVDFFIITDQSFANYNLTKNIRIINISLEKIECLINEKLNINVKFKYPYKLCDIKPAYGFIFQDYIRGYDFWGHIDIDLIFGDIREFITDETLSVYDIVSVRGDFLTGYFLLYKNIYDINTLFLKSKDYKYVFESNLSHCFDECNHLHSRIEFKKNNILNVPISSKSIESMEHVIQKEIRKSQIKVFYEFMVVEGTPGNITWSNGKLYYKREYEILLYHFIAFKKLEKKYIPKWDPFVKHISIGSNFIILNSNKVTPCIRLLSLSLKIKKFFRKQLAKKCTNLNLQNKIKIKPYLGSYCQSNLSIEYKLLIENDQLKLYGSNYSCIHMYHLFKKIYLTPDGLGFIKLKNKNNNYCLQVYPFNIQKSVYTKINT